MHLWKVSLVISGVGKVYVVFHMFMSCMLLFEFQSDQDRRTSANGTIGPGTRLAAGSCW